MEQLGYDVDNINKPINRQAVVSRNNPVVNEADTLASLTVGNGNFAVTVDVTGLQSYPAEYSNGVPLTTMSDWGWHSFANVDNLEHAETTREMDLGHGHKEVYAVEYKQGGRQQQATDFFRINPHRLNLGNIGLELKDANGNQIALNNLTDIHQELLLWDGKIESRFNADGTGVEVTTACMPKSDCLFSRIHSELLPEGRAAVTFKFPYPTGRHSDDASDWNANDRHSSKIVKTGDRFAVIERTLDDVRYYVNVQWEGNCSLAPRGDNEFVLTTTDPVLTFAAEYATKPYEKKGDSYAYDQAHKALLKYWPSFWNSGAMVDFSECTDPRAAELERRTILSLYLTALNASGNVPPQETGLTYNSWFGRPHLEMTWWHAVDHSLWSRPGVLAGMLDWYKNVAFVPASAIAGRQGFRGVRWMKMTDPEAGEAPSNTGSFLIWQQPHFIYMAEEIYRNNPTAETLERYGDQVEATAQFMADYAAACAPKKGNIKLFGQTSMQESMSKDFSYYHPFEQAYWKYGLEKAQQWRERRGLERNAEWDALIGRIAPLAEANGIYASGMPVKAFDKKAKSTGFDPYVSAALKGSQTISAEDFALKSRSDHPAVLGACGLLPDMGLYDSAKMSATLDYVMNNWNWGTTWGWDYGMIAMAAARLGRPDTALEALLIDKGKNTYLINGHNFQEPKRLRIYLPGNGSLLDAVAAMCAGWDGCKDVLNPGFPKDGTWNVRWEGLNRMQ
ncbi:MAG: hypothetical protein J1E63_06855 [Muribaculaceae bacterium]|nr:hypothetical protein [Muribaculaceae bacterium]